LVDNASLLQWRSTAKDKLHIITNIKTKKEKMLETNEEKLKYLVF